MRHASLAWAFACDLFAANQPFLITKLSSTERRLLDDLQQVKAVQIQQIGGPDLLCPNCHLRSGRLVEGATGTGCLCPSCGMVKVKPVDRQCVRLQPAWLARQLRGALDVPAEEPVSKLAEGVWRLGQVRHQVVVLVRRLDSAWENNGMPSRLFAGMSLRLIAPRSSWLRAAAPSDTVACVSLEDHFDLYGGRVVRSGAVRGDATWGLGPRQAGSPREREHGPFSSDFRWVWLNDDEPVQLSPAQAALFQALWSFAGQPRRGEQVMARAGLKGTKPGDVFKVKTQNKGNPRYEQPRRAYERFVEVNRFGGTYALKPGG